MLRTAEHHAVFSSIAFLLATCLSPYGALAATGVPGSSGMLSVAPGDSPWWSPRQENAGGDSAPIEWGADKNIAWVTEVPGRGHATPCVVGDQIFISTADDDLELMRLIAYDRQTGAEQWIALIHEGGFMHTHNKNSHASGTPACDGQRIFVAHMVSQEKGDGIYLTAVSLNGEILWQRLAGPFVTQHGYGSSPVLYGDTVIVVGDSDHDEPFLAAFDRETGDEAWRTRRSGGRSFGCPTILRVAGRDQLIIPGCSSTVSFDPSNGEMIWRVDGPSSSAANTVVADDTKVYSSGGWPEKNLLAIRADGEGDVSQSHIAWRHTKAVCYVPTMLVHDGMLFTVSDNGVATCYDTSSGDPLWTERLGGDFSASPVLVGDKIYIPDEDGVTHIFAATNEFTPIAKISLDDGGFATPVVVQSKIYLRTLHRLYCISE